MSSVAFRQVDVFTAVPFRGNPVAVIMDARELSAVQMQEIARWTNLSETTFVLPPENKQADYQVRIFTPESELPFAGHPTIGTAWALIESGIVNARNGIVVQECAAGLINLTVIEDAKGFVSIAFDLPEPDISVLTNVQVGRLEALLGCALDPLMPPLLVDVGARWIVAHVNDAAAVISVKPDYEKLSKHDAAMGVTGICIYGEYTDEAGMNIEVRSFAPACGVNEDPVCGSGNGSVAAFMRHYSVILPENGLVLSSQGRVIGREGKLQLRIESGKIRVGGHAITCINGTLNY
ncbi:PhzF family phenazine biosynthesis protein [Klebsiella sp. BIGb0407]|uniref:PhzF family phenazine biosynthesis protein n=1 Tax=Klebsiella sp. BIGb0407 TaxID=2940603 RepID=UPI002168B1B1|nr:PhzF family phenazine biosynthesis protein [Klebsiella sp. BIGb0407]MCS3429529.1 PhzF family phenazine biosynthesis protein [Klebsiella sp. BIGb0407]